MHRFILDAQLGELTDHKDHNGLNNQQANIRICTGTQNRANGRKHLGTLNKFKGVYWNKQAWKWQVQITISGKSIYLGCFKNETEAAKVYDKKAIELFGEYALTNF